MNNKLKDVIQEAFTLAINEKSIISSNTMRSSKFVEEVVKGIINNYFNPEQKNTYCQYVQEVKKDGSGKKSGEWLLDGVICEKIEIVDQVKPKSNSKIVKKMLWAIESESDTSMSAMAKDFGKLAVVNSENYLYLNGLDQHHAYVSEYIKRKLLTIEDFIHRANTGFPIGNLYYGFWPTPGKAQGKDSYWDIDDQGSLFRMIHLFEYKSGRFTEL